MDNDPEANERYNATQPHHQNVTQDSSVNVVETVRKSILISPHSRRSMGVVQNRSGVSKKVTFFDFKGLMAPVFTCFNDIDYTLEVNYIDRYAQWLKSQRINGVLINSITGEGPALGLFERKQNADAWWQAGLQHDFVVMLQVGGAPLPDVLELARQAEQLGVHAVLCLPELFYRPRSIDHLVGYCQLVARECHTRPFFYYHIPSFTDVHFDMLEFCQKAEESIPNFFGLQYSSADLEAGLHCLGDRRVVLLGTGPLLASGLLIGFESAAMAFLNIRPDLGFDIYDAMNRNDLATAKEKQQQLNKLLHDQLGRVPLPEVFSDSWVRALKNWFNSQEERKRRQSAGFSAGPARNFF